MSRWSLSRKATASAPRPGRAELGVALSAARPPDLCPHRALSFSLCSLFFLFSSLDANLLSSVPFTCTHTHTHTFLTISFMFAYRFFGVAAAQTENDGLTLWFEGASCFSVVS